MPHDPPFGGQAPRGEHGDIVEPLTLGTVIAVEQRIKYVAGDDPGGRGSGKTHEAVLTLKTGAYSHRGHIAHPRPDMPANPDGWQQHGAPRAICAVDDPKVNNIQKQIRRLVPASLVQ
ncbi:MULTISPECIES: hypothetical protein [unclassified Methylobacterium]|uniref:hypothetical protein n=1 Tax=unclassified Methylobacterium TaxID=2615210 RepID=UPI001FEEFF1A|nr:MULTISPECIES: hypothetical protein [unclassified Methylobacterium]